MPNFQGRYLKQGTSGTYGNESLPNITGYYGNNPMNAVQDYGGCFSLGHDRVFINLQQLTGNSYEWQQIQFNAANSSSVYQSNAKVNPDNAEILYCIKY